MIKKILGVAALAGVGALVGKVVEKMVDGETIKDIAVQSLIRTGIVALKAAEKIKGMKIMGIVTIDDLEDEYDDYFDDIDIDDDDDDGEKVCGCDCDDCNGADSCTHSDTASTEENPGNVKEPVAEPKKKNPSTASKKEVKADEK